MFIFQEKEIGHQIHSLETVPGLASFLESTKCPFGRFMIIYTTLAIKEGVMGWPLKITSSFKNYFLPLFSPSKYFFDFFFKI